MSSHYQQKYRATTSNIYSILDNLEDRLNGYSGNSYYPTKISNNQNINDNNQLINGAQNFKNPKYDNNNIDNIRNIIIKEFNSLILPYQKDLYSNINALESKINKISMIIMNL